jgi:hypothetical protein
MNIDSRNIEVIDDAMAEVLKKKTPPERLMIAFQMCRSVRKQLIHYIRTTHPDWDEAVVQKEVIKRLSHGAL